MGVPDFLAYARMPGPVQTAIGTMGALAQQQAERQRMGIAQEAEQRAEALAPYQLTTAQQTAEEQPIKFSSDIATAAINRRLSTAKAIQALQDNTYKGPAADAISLLRLKNKHGENSEVYQNAIKEFESGIQMKKARALSFASNYWMTRMTPLQKNQLSEGFQKENVARQNQGLAPLTMEQYAVAAGYKPSVTDNKADAINAHVDEIQLNQVKNGQPITPAHQIINHIAQGGDATQLPGAQGAPITPSIPDIPAGEAYTRLAPLPAGLQEAPPPVTTTPAPIQQVTTPQVTAQRGGIQLLTTPDYGKQAAQTGLSTLRQTSDAQNRSKIVYGNQAENTISNMLPDLDASTAYSGPGGWTQFQADQKLFQQIGKASPQYLAFNRFITNAKILKDQATQYFGKSIMPAAQEELDDTLNPKKWIESPEVMKTRFNTFAKTLRQEINIRKDALRNPEAYYSEKSGGPESYTADDYAKTARETGLTVAQIKADLARRRGQ